MPRRMSVVPAASQTRTPEAGIIIRAEPTSRGGAPPGSHPRRCSRARRRSARSQSAPLAVPWSSTAVVPLPASYLERPRSGPGKGAPPDRLPSQLPRGGATDRPGSGKDHVARQCPGRWHQRQQTRPRPSLERQRRGRGAAHPRSRSVALPRYLWLPQWQPHACFSSCSAGDRYPATGARWSSA